MPAENENPFRLRLRKKHLICKQLLHLQESYQEMDSLVRLMEKTHLERQHQLELLVEDLGESRVESIQSAINESKAELEQLREQVRLITQLMDLDRAMLLRAAQKLH